MDLPQTHYAQSCDGVHVAHPLVGDGRVDIGFVPAAIDPNLTQAFLLDGAYAQVPATDGDRHASAG